jgi:hypothetical protein
LWSDVDVWSEADDWAKVDGWSEVKGWAKVDVGVFEGFGLPQIRPRDQLLTKRQLFPNRQLLRNRQLLTAKKPQLSIQQSGFCSTDLADLPDISKPANWHRNADSQPRPASSCPGVSSSQMPVVTRRCL